MYQFSAPMPYTIEHIDKLLEINNKTERSKITSLYFSLPITSKLFTGFEQDRNFMFDKDWNYWQNLIDYSIKKGADFIYLLNSPEIDIEQENFEQKLDKLDTLLNEFRKIGVNKLRISEHRLMGYIAKNYPDFIIYASTSFELKSLSEYQNLIYMHNTVKQIVPSHDTIKNFAFLKNLKKLLPNIEIELMVNEGCLNGCPNRKGHSGSKMHKNTVIRNDINLSVLYYNYTFCTALLNKSPFYSLVKANVIYPWEIEEYKKIGITNFKLVGRDFFGLNKYKYIESYFLYLKGIEDFKFIENIPINMLIHHLSRSAVLKQLKVKDVYKLLPQIKHFKKYGELCNANCGINCNYCYKCAEKIQKAHRNKIKRLSEQQASVQVCKI